MNAFLISIAAIACQFVGAIEWSINWFSCEPELSFGQGTDFVISLTGTYQSDEKYKEFPMADYQKAALGTIALRPKGLNIPLYASTRDYDIRLPDDPKLCHVINARGRIGVQCKTSFMIFKPRDDVIADWILRGEYDAIFRFDLKRDRSARNQIGVYLPFPQFQVKFTSPTIPPAFEQSPPPVWHFPQFGTAPRAGVPPDVTANSLKMSGDTFTMFQDYEQARVFYTEALQYSTASSVLRASILRNRAIAAFKLDKLNDCISDAKDSISLNANDGLAFWIYGTCLAEMADKPNLIPEGKSETDLITQAITALESATQKGCNSAECPFQQTIIETLDIAGSFEKIRKLKQRLSGRTPDSFYVILGVDRFASKQEIRANYLVKAREIHPDKNPGDPDATEKFKNLQHAYETLMDDTKRRQYDREFSSGRSTSKRQRS